MQGGAIQDGAVSGKKSSLKSSVYCKFSLREPAAMWPTAAGRAGGGGDESPTHVQGRKNHLRDKCYV